MSASHTEWLDGILPDVGNGLATCWECPVGGHAERGLNLSGRRAVAEVLDELVAVMFPGCHGHEPVPADTMRPHLQETLRAVSLALTEQVRRAFEYECRREQCEDCGDCSDQAHAAMGAFLGGLPAAQQVLQEDIVAAYEGDPAAKSTMEVVMSYPGMYAVIVHRLAHLLYQQQVPLIPRIMSEHAHSLTGIDIHPGATIGPGFFIDHGTGVVIGETCVIGRRVKLYQGVTLGALSFEKDEQGHLVKGTKRHPDVEDHVVIYAGATILGGKTVIGAHSVIGGNVWLVHSVPPYSKVYDQQPRPLIRQVDGQWTVSNMPWADLGGGI